MIKERMEALYREHDPWKYEQENRHWLTVAIAKQFWPETGRVLVEFPCAEGRLLESIVQVLVPTPRRVVSADIAPTAVERARVRVSNTWLMKACRSVLDIQEGDIRAGFPVLEEPADLVVLSDVIPFGENRPYGDVIVQNAFQMVKPSGVLVVTTWLDPDEVNRVSVPEGLSLVPEDGEVEMEMTWKGWARDLTEERVPTEARYRVIRRTS